MDNHENGSTDRVLCQEEDRYDLHADWLNDNRIPAGLEDELENFGVRDTYGALTAFRDQEIRRMI